MSKILVIGYGNTLRGDDGAGVHAAELIAKNYPEIQSIYTHQLTPELAVDISESDIVCFIDADVSVKELTVRLISPNAEEAQARSHFISPESLLTLAHQLYNRRPAKVFVIGIPATQFDFGEKLSEPTEAAVKDAVKFIDELINPHKR